jgi:RHS repeat-associated protein
MLRGGTTSYYQQDGLGSISSLSNSAGALANTYAYDSFGNLTAFTGTLTNPFRFTGREFDSETGIYGYRARYYDPSAGRFSSEDPLGFGGGLNFYEYGYNNPTDFIDPFGLQSTRPGCPLYVPCGPSAYGPPTDTTPPPPPTPGVPSWWPGSGPGSGSVPTSTMGPSPTPGPGPTPAPSPSSDRASEYSAYKNRCNQPPPPGLSPCDLARWKLQRNRDCRNMRQAWDDRWMPGRHANDIANLDRSIANLEAWIKQNCGCK